MSSPPSGDDVASEPLPRRGSTMAHESLKSRFLIAAPTLRDPNFARAVVLLCEHNESGTFGLVINRPSTLAVREALADFPGTLDRSDFLWQGGPVQQSSVVILHERPSIGGLAVNDRLAFGTDVDLLRKLLELPPDECPRMRLYAGYAGWGAGQLEFELSEEAWIVAPSRIEAIFSDQPETVWSSVLRSMGGRYAIMAMTPPDPSLN